MAKSFNAYETTANFFGDKFCARVSAVALSPNLLTVTFSGDSTNGSPIILNSSSAVGLSIGQILAGIGIPAGTSITAILTTTTKDAHCNDVVVTNTVTMSAPATATNVGVSIKSSPYIYVWKEQAFNPVTGAPFDLDGGRSGDSTECPLIEMNNQNLLVPFYAGISHRTRANGTEVYEFEAAGTTAGPGAVSITIVTNVCPIYG
jgi:hypothetical protein